MAQRVWLAQPVLQVGDHVLRSRPQCTHIAIMALSSYGGNVCMRQPWDYCISTGNKELQGSDLPPSLLVNIVVEMSPTRICAKPYL